MYVNVWSRCLYSTISLTHVREWHSLRNICYYYLHASFVLPVFIKIKKVLFLHGFWAHCWFGLFNGGKQRVVSLHIWYCLMAHMYQPSSITDADCCAQNGSTDSSFHDFQTPKEKEKLGGQIYQPVMLLWLSFRLIASVCFRHSIRQVVVLKIHLIKTFLDTAFITVKLPTDTEWWRQLVVTPIYWGAFVRVWPGCGFV